MRVVLNEDKLLVRSIKKELQENEGHCPSSRVKVDDTKCICKDFRDKLEDPQFIGLCECQLYNKIEA